MINCPKCGADNLIGAIFCRGCGEKLNLDELKPEHIQQAARKERKKDGSLVRNLIALILLLAVAGVLTAVLLPPEFNRTESADEKGFARANGLLNALVKARGKKKFVFTLAEVNALARDVLQLTPKQLEERATAIAKGEVSASGFTVPYDLSIELLDGGLVRLVLKSKIYDKVPMYTVLVGAASASEGGGLWFTPEKVYAGRLPVYGKPFQDAIIARFTALTENNEPFNKSIQPAIEDLTINGTDITFISRK